MSNEMTFDGLPLRWCICTKCREEAIGEEVEKFEREHPCFQPPSIWKMSVVEPEKGDK